MATAKRSTGSSSKSTTSRSRSSASKSASARNGTAKTRAQAPKAGTTRSRAKATGTASANGASRTKSTASSRRTAQSRKGSARSTKARSSTNGSSRSNGSSRNGTHAGAASQAQERVVGKLRQTGTAVRHAADKAGRPTITVAAAVAGIAGGLALRGRHTSANDGVAARSMAMLHDADPAAILGGLGKATVQLSQRSKTVARDIERVAEQAERLGKILS